jgi:hypothetical protein
MLEILRFIARPLAYSALRSARRNLVIMAWISRTDPDGRI